MSGVVHRGCQGPNIVARRFFWDPRNGWRTEITYEGTLEALQGQFAVVRVNADGVELRPDGPVGQLTASFGNEASTGGTELPETTWELIGQVSQTSILEKPESLALGDRILSAIREFSQTQRESEETYEQFKARQETLRGYVTAAATADGKSATDAGTLFDLLANGNDLYYTRDYVLRRVQVVSRHYTTALAHTGIHELWTRQQIEAAESPVPSVALGLSNISDPSSLPTGYKYRWLKQPPVFAQVANYKFQLTQEWWLRSWSTWVYSEYS